jgi:hypothetical protein
MKNVFTTIATIALMVTASQAKASSLPVGSKPDSGVYVCGFSPDTIIAQAAQLTVYLGDNAAALTQSTVAKYGFQKEDSRTHENELASKKETAAGYEITAKMYSSETAQFVKVLQFTLNTKNLVLNLPISQSQVLPIPCQKLFPQ